MLSAFIHIRFLDIVSIAVLSQTLEIPFENRWIDSWEGLEENCDFEKNLFDLFDSFDP